MAIPPGCSSSCAPSTRTCSTCARCPTRSTTSARMARTFSRRRCGCSESHLGGLRRRGWWTCRLALVRRRPAADGALLLDVPVLVERDQRDRDQHQLHGDEQQGEEPEQLLGE